MLSMVEKGLRGGICHIIHRYVKANNKYMKDYDKNKESSYLKYWDVSNSCGWAMSQKLPVGGFKWVENTSPQFSKDFMKPAMKIKMKDIFLNLMFNTLKIYTTFTMIYHVYQKEWKLKQLENLQPSCMIKNTLYT